MQALLENPFIQFKFDARQSAWDLLPVDGRQLSLAGARMRVGYRCGRRPYQLLDRLEKADLAALPGSLPSPHGPLRQVELRLAPDDNGLACRLTFALPEAQPLLLWKLTLHNTGGQPVYPERLELLQVGGAAAPGKPIGIRGLNSPESAFFSNGWQSMSYSGVYAPSARQRRTRLGPLLEPMVANAGTPRPRRPGHFASDFFGVLGDRASRQAVLAGFLSQEQHFGSLESVLQPGPACLSMWANGDLARLDPGQDIETDWACLHFLNVDDSDPLAPYLQAVARQHGIDEGRLAMRAVPVGWSSWYHYFDRVSAQDIAENLEFVARYRSDIPMDIIQIDDGFETRVGDWYSLKSTFPDGLQAPARQIHQAGFAPGLWLAPFIAVLNSRLARTHPEWLLRGRLNRPANGGLSSVFWGSTTTGLDLTHPDAQAYVQDLIDTAVQRWGYSYLKLDFLYAAALPGRRRDPTRTRAQVLRQGLRVLRQAAGEGTFLLGSVCPLGSGIGLLDAMRVEADVDARWRPALLGSELIVRQEWNLPAARNSTQGALARAFLHRHWWLNDPDCLLLRPSTDLTLAEIQTRATVAALSGGALFFSDKLAELPPERLRVAQCLLPALGQRPRVPDWFDEPMPRKLRLDLESPAGRWHLLALFNWQDQPRDLLFNLAEYDLQAQGACFGREFWSGKVYAILDGRLTLRAAPAHSVALLALRPHTPGSPQYLGSDLHISQGMEVGAWEGTVEQVSLRLERPGSAKGQVDLYLPGPPRQAWLDQAPLTWQAWGDVYRFPLEFRQSARLRLEL